MEAFCSKFTSQESYESRWRHGRAAGVRPPEDASRKEVLGTQGRAEKVALIFQAIGCLRWIVTTRRFHPFLHWSFWQIKRARRNLTSHPVSVRKNTNGMRTYHRYMVRWRLGLVFFCSGAFIFEILLPKPPRGSTDADAISVCRLWLGVKTPVWRNRM